MLSVEEALEQILSRVQADHLRGQSATVVRHVKHSDRVTVQLDCSALYRFHRRQLDAPLALFSPFNADALGLSQMQTGMFGQAVLNPVTVKELPLFHEPVIVELPNTDTPEDARIRRQYDPQATPMLPMLEPAKL